MVKMVPHEAFACRCEEGDVVLRQSYKHESYALRNLLDVDYFMERDPTSRIDEYLLELHRLQKLLVQDISTPPSYSSGPSTPPSYSSGPSTPTNYSLGSSRNESAKLEIILFV
ncbi:hypothetical protein Tco_1265409 [Tanacetum coccineum]